MFGMFYGGVTLVNKTAKGKFLGESYVSLQPF